MKRTSEEPYRLYFSYGSNLNKEHMKHRCPDAIPVCKAVLRHWRLEYRGVLTIVPSPGDEVHGAMWLTSDDDEAALDRYEGWPRLYRKELHLVHTDEAEKPALVYVYIMNPGRREVGPPSDQYLDVCLKGAKDWRIPVRHLMRPAIAAEKAWAKAQADGPDVADDVKWR